jgi:hypothetical protein
MPSKILATLDPHRLGDGLSLSQGNLVVTTTKVCDIHRSVFGTIAMAEGKSAFECQFWSTSKPQAGLANLCSVGVAEASCSLAKYAGEEAASWGLRPTEAAVYNNNASISGAASPAIQAIPERAVIGVFLDCTASPPIAVWHVNGNPIFQATLTANKFYVPVVSIGSTVAGDVSAYVNFGQRLLNYPLMSVTK